MQQHTFSVTDYSKDTTHVIDLRNLEPKTCYGYLLWEHSQERVLLGHNRLRRFRTPREETEAFQFAVFSCHRPYDTIEPLRGPPGRRQRLRRGKRTTVINIGMWESLGDTLRRYADRVDFLIAAGDQCYVDADTLNIWSFLKDVLLDDDEQPTKEAMLSWYRDIYRGYWGFQAVQNVFDRFPTYMIWDDHEIVDGWGSQKSMDELLGDADDFPSIDKSKIAQRMFEAATKGYEEYQHSHNPPTANGQYDYAFEHSSCSFYILDGRGSRDIQRKTYSILGAAQFSRFRDHVEGLENNQTKILFVISAVPLLHLRASLLKYDEVAFGMGDDLRDAWEHESHADEYNELLGVLFSAAEKGIGVCVVSGETHMSAVFEIEDGDGNRIYQLTSSAITASDNPVKKWVVEKFGMAEEGKVGEKYCFRRLALCRANSYAIVDVDIPNNRHEFRIHRRDGMEMVVPLKL